MFAYSSDMLKTGYERILVGTLPSCHWPFAVQVGMRFNARTKPKMGGQSLVSVHQGRLAFTESPPDTLSFTEES